MPYDQSDPAHCLNPDVTGDVRESVEIGASTLVYGFMHCMIACHGTCRPPPWQSETL